MLYIDTHECHSPDDIEDQSRILMVRSPSYHYQRLAICRPVTSVGMSWLEYSNLYEAMFGGYSTVEGEYTPPRGRPEPIDRGDRTITRIREFMEETGGCFLPGWRKEPQQQLTEVWVGLDGRTYECNYGIYIDHPMTFLSHLTAETILKHLDAANDTKHAARYSRAFPYNRRNDSLKCVCFLSLRECLTHLNRHRIRTILPLDMSLLKLWIAMYIKNKIKNGSR